MYLINTIDAISSSILQQLNSQQFSVTTDTKNPHAILVRSTSLHEYDIPESLEVVGRAGAGTNNIPTTTLTNLGIPVFNTPGANANAVKELVLTGLLLASRNICQALDFMKNASGDNQEINKHIEKNKKQFVGTELPGKTLGIIGLGKIGVLVANSAHQLGMDVIGYDPNIQVTNAWQLNSAIHQAEQLSDILKNSDYISIHIPLTTETKHIINNTTITQTKPGSVILNFSRAQIVDPTSMKESLDKNHTSTYVSDFPSTELQNHSQTITLPHLGASTIEAQENCAKMITKQIESFLLDGNIIHSVNFPEIKLTRSSKYRLSIANKNIPNMVAQISSVLSSHDINITEMINKSREDIAYNLIDIDKPIKQEQIIALQNIPGVLRIRYLS